MAQSEYDQFAQGLPHDAYLVQTGRYQACRNIVDLVDNFLDKVKGTNEREWNAHKYKRDHAERTTYASPNYKP